MSEGRGSAFGVGNRRADRCCPGVLGTRADRPCVAAQPVGGQTLPGIPATWPSDRYDVVLRLDRATAGAPWSFRQLFPRLLAGDSDTSL